MGAICGIIDFNEKASDFDAIKRMWCAMAPFSRAYTYINKGISLCCDRLQGAYCSLSTLSSQKKAENCTLMLDSYPPFPLYTKEILERYLIDGAEVICELKQKFSFALFDESNRFLMLSSARTPFFCSRCDDKIIFSTDKKAVGAYFDGSFNIPVQPVKLKPEGLALFCDIKQN